ncbi:MAG: type II/IV secretion system ATPase subunit [Candidatus Woesearchaeota archaeon]
MSKLVEQYVVSMDDVIINIEIFLDDEDAVHQYKTNITNISETTKIILEKIREEFVSKINLGSITIADSAQVDKLREQFRKEIKVLLKKYFPDLDIARQNMLMNYLVSQDLGLGDLEIVLRDEHLEEIVVNNAHEPIWVYHKKYGWCKTNIFIDSEKKIRHYATMIARGVNKEITALNPLLDAHLRTGDRINATLAPISSFGNTITIRKFAKDPWTITDFLRNKTISYEAAALVWLAIQYEIPTLVVGGTGSGKTSMLNVLSNFFPPNQRIISIEDTRELMLPKNLHWLAMETRLGNPEGKGMVSMLDLLVNSLRQRPDRIVVGEIRRKEEAEVMLEAAHTGHSVYATFHANDAQEAVVRLTNSPISIPRQTLTALTLMLVQNRNRRTGSRRTLQVAEILPNGDPNILLQYDTKTDGMKRVNPSKVFYNVLNLFAGLQKSEVDKDLQDKVRVLQWLVKKNIRNVDEIGVVVAKYYRGILKLS